MTTLTSRDTDTIPQPGGPWLKLSSELSQLTDWYSVTGRRDLIAKICPGATAGAQAGGVRAPACLWHDKATIAIDADLAGITDPSFRPASRLDDREALAPVIGLLVHEVAHADHTRWTRHPHDVENILRGQYDGDSRVVEAALLLEEPRIEFRHLQKRDFDDHWLRCSALKHILGGITGDQVTARHVAAQVVTLIAGRMPGLARYDETDEAARSDLRGRWRRDPVIIPDDDETAVAILDKAKAILGNDDYRALCSIVAQAVTARDNDLGTMLALGSQWVELVYKGVQQQVQVSVLVAAQQQGQEQDGQQQGNGSKSQQSEQDKKQDGQGSQEQDKQEAGKDGKDDSQDGQGAGDPLTALITEVGKLDARISEDAGWKVVSIGYVNGAAADLKPDSWKKATEKQRTAAGLLKRRLLNWFIPERAATRVDSVLPPGRLRIRGAIRQSAEQAMGLPPTGEPWRRTDRRMVHTPPLRAGLIVDVSGSMDGLASASREIAYRFAETFSQLPDCLFRGQVAGHGTAQFETRPGQVAVYDYGHGEQNVHLALEELTDRLQLLRRSNARLVVIISDGGFTPTENNSCQEQITRLARTGCRFLWITPRGARHYVTPEMVSVTPGCTVLAVDNHGSVDAIVAEAEDALEQVMTRDVQAA